MSNNNGRRRKNGDANVKQQNNMLMPVVWQQDIPIQIRALVVVVIITPISLTLEDID